MTGALLLPILVGLAVSGGLECGLTPRPQPLWQRAIATLMLHSGSWLLLFALALAVFQRPWFAVVLLWALQLLLVLVNQAKHDSLREAFIFQDFEYFTDAIKHPRLYLPFFGIARTLAATFGFISAVTIGLWLETPLTTVLPLTVLLLIWLMLVVSSLGLLKVGLTRCPTITYEPAEDLYQLGQIAFFWAYWSAEKHQAITVTPSPFHDVNPTAITEALPHIVAVQSESFFDARCLSDTIKPEVLAHFDQITTEALHHGRLHVPAWGANTVRSECGFLTGLTPEQLGIHRFNPYRWLKHQTVPNLAAHYRQLGYQTVCIHPYPASFYQRDQVFPRMGFDVFFDLSSFDNSEKNGQYISDRAVANKVSALLQTQHSQPLFIFVITMENHGPLHLEQANPADLNHYHQPPLACCHDLTVYLGHLQQADLMVKAIKDALLACCQPDHAAPREGVFCWYGDHVPIMTDVYQQLGEPDGKTDYFIWHTAQQKSPTASTTAQSIAVSDLTTLLLNLL